MSVCLLASLRDRISISKLHPPDVEDYKFGGIRHASVIGLIDPTGSIPNGMVYIPGMGKRLPSKIFITRSPCTEVSHGRVVEVAKELPPDAFQFFNREYSFGSVVFALEKENPLPMKLADGDLGESMQLDLYCHFTLLTSLHLFQTEIGISSVGMTKSFLR